MEEYKVEIGTFLTFKKNLDFCESQKLSTMSQELKVILGLSSL